MKSAAYDRANMRTHQGEEGSMLGINMLSRTPARRAIAVWTLSLLMAACVRHLPVVGDEDPPRGGGSAKGPIAGIGARRSAESAQRSAAAGSNQKQEQEQEPSESDTPAAGMAGSKAAASSGSAPKAGSDAPKAGSSAASAGKAGSSAPASSAEAMGGSAAPSTASTPSTPSGGSTPSGSSSGNSWYCAQAANACSCAEAPAGSATPGDTCTKPHPTCCYELTNMTTYRTCVCFPDGSPECMAYSMNAIPNIKKASSCPL